MRKERLLFQILILGFLSSGCGRIWGGVTWLNGNYPSSAFAYQCSQQVFLEGYTNSGNAPGLSGSGFSYSISPSLPAGLNLDPSSGIISGTPTIAHPMTAYTITINYPGGTTTTTVNIRTAVGWLVNDLGHDADNAPLTANHCTIAGFGTCTLRAAVDEINTGGSSRTVILLPAGSTTISNVLGAVNITAPVDIYGNCSSSTTLDGGGNTEIMAASNSGNISFNYLTIQNGSQATDGVGIFIGNSGVASFNASIDHCTIQNNTTPVVGFTTHGTGVAAEGAVGNPVVLSISNSTFFNNQDLNTNGAGGGLCLGTGANPSVQATITNSSFISNTDAGGGGAGAIIYHGTGLTVTDTLFYNNSLSGNGGGGVATYSNASATMNFTNVTFDSNTNTGAGGGSVFLGSGGSSANMTNCTFANNSTAGGVFLSISSGNLANSIFYDNGNICAGGTTLTTLGGNLSDDVAIDCNLNTGLGDIVSANANLGTLQSNGGPTQTMALQTGSPAINHAVVVNCPSTDQRGNSRHIPTSCDIGAYEHEP